VPYLQVVCPFCREVVITTPEHEAAICSCGGTDAYRLSVVMREPVSDSDLDGRK